MGTHSIIGTWSLVSMVARGSKGAAFYPSGENPEGRIIYTASGDVAMVLMRPGRANFATGDLLGGDSR